MGIKERLAAIEEKLGIESQVDGAIIVWDKERTDGSLYSSRFRDEDDDDDDVMSVWDHFAYLTPEIIAAINILPEAEK